MLTIEPPPFASIAASSARMQKNVPSRWTAITWCHDSIGYSPTSACAPAMPALLTAMSRRPKVSVAVPTIVRHDATSLTSTATASAASPISPATRSAASCLRSATTTFAPRSASSRAHASPIPDPAPVTSATLPSSSCAIALPPRPWLVPDSPLSSCLARCEPHVVPGRIGAMTTPPEQPQPFDPSNPDPNAPGAAAGQPPVDPAYGQPAGGQPGYGQQAPTAQPGFTPQGQPAWGVSPSAPY